MMVLLWLKNADMMALLWLKNVDLIDEKNTDLMDADVLWLRDPFRYLSLDEDFQVACGVGDPLSLANPVNTGFVYAWANIRIISLYKYWYKAGEVSVIDKWNQESEVVSTKSMCREQQDADVLWLRDPFRYLSLDEDFQVACGVGDPLSLANPVNTGFVYARANIKTISVYKYWYKVGEVFSELNDQNVFDKIKQDEALKEIGDTQYILCFCQPSDDLEQMTLRRWLLCIQLLFCPVE
ncbi:hypothetical protein L7F22_062439 [Adiantum nelumboides]|nr:hypothetical protein [Adiantum nelumboides]